MITTETKAILKNIGVKVMVKFEMDITDHMGREILDAVASLFNDTPDNCEIVRTEKVKLSLSRKAKEDLDQANFLEEEGSEVPREPLMLEHVIDAEIADADPGDLTTDNAAPDTDMPEVDESGEQPY